MTTTSHVVPALVGVGGPTGRTSNLPSRVTYIARFRRSGRSHGPRPAPLGWAGRGSRH